MDPLAPKIQVSFFGITDVGRKRKQNEDNLLLADLQSQKRAHHMEHGQWQVKGRGLLFAVCDGMGGAAAGEIASQMAVDVVYKELLDLEPGLEPQVFAEIVDRAVLTANHQIRELALRDTSKKGWEPRFRRLRFMGIFSFSRKSETVGLIFFEQVSLFK